MAVAQSALMPTCSVAVRAKLGVAAQRGWACGWTGCCPAARSDSALLMMPRPPAVLTVTRGVVARPKNREAAAGSVPAGSRQEGAVQSLLPGNQALCRVGTLPRDAMQAPATRPKHSRQASFSFEVLCFRLSCLLFSLLFRGPPMCVRHGCALSSLPAAIVTLPARKHKGIR
eukprot:6214121-Pleurochrysis_carterae.AAC.4